MSENTRREFLKKSVIVGAAAAVVPGVLKAKIISPAVGFAPQKLAYSPEALEPHIDAQTMQIHYGKHYHGYVKKLNKGLEEIGESDQNDIVKLCKNISSFTTFVKNNAGGTYNHELFWQVMSPKGKTLSSESQLASSIKTQLSGLDNLKEKFNNAAAGQFGSGWAWLIVDEQKKLQITSTPNQDNPLMDDQKVKGTPILGLDVWEHAYYLKYQNQRKEYINAWWNVVNWEKVDEFYKKAIA